MKVSRLSQAKPKANPSEAKRKAKAKHDEDQGKLGLAGELEARFPLSEDHPN